METVQILTRYQLTVEDFEKMGKAGIFSENDRVELVEGDLIKMAPIGQKHLGVVVWLTKTFNTKIPGSLALISVQNPIQLDDYSELYPDIALLRQRDDFYTSGKPTAADVFLVVEVADTTLRYDRETKIPLYAQHQIPEAWLLDLTNKQIEIYLQPHEGQYRQILKPGLIKQLSPSTMPDISIDLTELWGLLKFQRT